MKQSLFCFKRAVTFLLITALCLTLVGTPTYAAKKRNSSSSTGLDETTRLTMVVDAFNIANAQRAAAGLPALEWNDSLYNASVIRSIELNSLYSHTRPDGTPCYTAAPDFGLYSYGENIQMGTSSSVKTAAGAIDNWMNSPGHRANILSDRYHYMTLSLYVVNGVYYWTQSFAI